MKKNSFLAVIACIATLCSCGGKIFEVDADILQKEIYEPTAVKLPALGQSVTLYLDHSTCVIDANKNSPVFKALKGQLGLYTDTLCLIKGNNFEVIENTNKSPTSTTVFNTINDIKEDIPYTNIGGAVKKICDGNSQAVLITDCEYFDANHRNQDGFPYLSGAFKNWIEKGHCIHIVTEPYKEKYKGKTCDKKRFYFIFSDDKMQAPISHNLLDEIKQSLQDGSCTLFKLTNSDIAVGLPTGKDMFSPNLTISKVEQRNLFTIKDNEITKIDFEYVELDDSWEDIRTYIMKLNAHGDPLQNDEGTGAATPIPLIQNLVFNEGENYKITDIEVIATNITTQYVALEDTTVTSSVTETKEGFMLDKQALRQGKINVFVTEKVFDYLYLKNEYGGNLIRLDFIATQADVTPYNSDMFTWQSFYDSDKATCVSKSIENVLFDLEINPATAPNRKVIHTVFLKTQGY